jgi:predicted dehydrogenase
MDKVRVGIIGCGGRGCGHALGYSQSPRAELVACCDSHLPAAEIMAERFGFAKAYSDHQEMLEKERLDVVSMCLWPELHCPVVLDIANASYKPRLINAEKPMAPTFGEAVRMHEVCTEKGIQLTFSHQRRFGRTFKLAKDLIDEGEIGDLQRMEMNCSNLFDWGTHWFDMMLFYNHDLDPDWVMGQIDVSADSLVFGARIETAGIAYVKWPNNVSGLLTTGSGTAAPSAIRVIGSKGMMDVDHGKVQLLKAGADWQTVPPRIENIPGSDTSYHMIDSIDCLFEGRTSTLCSANALRATQLIFGTYESARARKRVILPLKTDDSALLTMLERGEKAIPAWPAFLTDEEKEDGFELLYNGRDLTGWTQDSAAWTAERGILFGGHDEPGVIRTTKTFTNFSLVFEARFANRAEGSLFLRGCDADGALTGIEIPLVENRTDPVSKDSACGVRGVVAPNQDPRFGSSRWLWIEAVCNGENLKVMCDDHDLLDIELSDYPELANLPPKGFIAFQSRSGWMDIRNLMIQPCD